MVCLCGWGRRERGWRLKTEIHLRGVAPPSRCNRLACVGEKYEECVG